MSGKPMLRYMLASCLGLGWLPIAPGTWGSLPAAVAFALLMQFGTPSVATSSVMVVLITTGSLICVLCAPTVVRMTGKDDPGQVVADELAGQAVTFVYLPLSAGGDVSAVEGWVLAGVGFLLFRLFDIIKPWPIRKLEKLPGGWGILADDLLAGVFAAVVLQAAWMLWLADALTRN